MVKPSRDRVRKWREKKAKKGGRSLSTWLEPEIAQMMDFLLKHYGETVAPLVARAITTLYQATCNEAPIPVAEQPESVAQISATGPVDPASMLREEPLMGEQRTESEIEAVAGFGAPEIDPLLSEIKEKIAQGKPVRILQKTLLVEWIKSMQMQSVSFEAMAERLNAAQIPTLSGQGKWEQGMIPTVLLLSSF